jgi:hypothetical protein
MADAFVNEQYEQLEVWMRSANGAKLRFVSTEEE